MIKYKTTINENEITLNLMGREKTFLKDEEVTGDAYTKAYPQYFKKIGEVIGYNAFLATPVFIPDPIQEFVQREEARKSVKVQEDIHEVKEVDIDDIAEDVQDVQDVQDVTFETEE